MALLTPEDRRATQSGLSGALSEYYSSPGRLAVYRRKFESMVRQDEEDPTKFATELETLAVRGFADAGPAARIRMVRDLFVAGHRDCELWRHLDNVPLDTPIWDIVAECGRATLTHTVGNKVHRHLLTLAGDHRGLPRVLGKWARLPRTG